MTVRLQELSFQDLEQLREQITEYYETYYAELRTRLSDHTSPLSVAAPDHLKGYRRIVTELGSDGLIITHWPAGQDSFDFHISPDRTVRNLVGEQCAGEQVLDFPPGSDFGFYQFAEPLQLVVDDRVVWVSEWKRMDISSRVDVWQNPEVARKAVEEDLRSYSKS
jgi:hypothetical protein